MQGLPTVWGLDLEVLFIVTIVVGLIGMAGLIALYTRLLRLSNIMQTLHEAIDRSVAARESVEQFMADVRRLKQRLAEVEWKQLAERERLALLETKGRGGLRPGASGAGGGGTESVARAAGKVLVGGGGGNGPAAPGGDAGDVRTETTSATTVQYFPAPDRDGSFAIARGKLNRQPGVSVYLFEIDAPNAHAAFSLIEDPEVVRRALATPHSYLRPVCEIANEYFPFPSRIVTEEQGKATATGERWTVTAKARIRYA